jgi:hypothetical protein
VKRTNLKEISVLLLEKTGFSIGEIIDIYINTDTVKMARLIEKLQPLLKDEEEKLPKMQKIKK